MTTATRTKTDALTELAKLEAALEKAEQRQAELDASLVEKREVLDGPLYDRNAPGAIGQLQDLLQRDPEQFKADGTPTGPEAKKLQAAIDQVGDLGPLAQQAEHARRLVGKAALDRDAFIRARGDEIETGRRAEGERLRSEYETKVRALLDVAERMIGYGQRSMNLAAIRGIETRLIPLDAISNATHIIRELAESPPPVPSLEDGDQEEGE